MPPLPVPPDSAIRNEEATPHPPPLNDEQTNPHPIDQFLATPAFTQNTSSIYLTPHTPAHFNINAYMDEIDRSNSHLPANQFADPAPPLPSPISPAEAEQLRLMFAQERSEGVPETYMPDERRDERAGDGEPGVDYDRLTRADEDGGGMSSSIERAQAGQGRVQDDGRGGNERERRGRELFSFDFALPSWAIGGGSSGPNGGSGHGQDEDVTMQGETGPAREIENVEAGQSSMHQPPTLTRPGTVSWLFAPPPSQLQSTSQQSEHPLASGHATLVPISLLSQQQTFLSTDGAFTTSPLPIREGGPSDRVRFSRSRSPSPPNRTVGDGTNAEVTADSGGSRIGTGGPSTTANENENEPTTRYNTQTVAHPWLDTFLTNRPSTSTTTTNEAERGQGSRLPGAFEAFTNMAQLRMGGTGQAGSASVPASVDAGRGGGGLAAGSNGMTMIFDFGNRNGSLATGVEGSAAQTAGDDQNMDQGGGQVRDTEGSSASATNRGGPSAPAAAFAALTGSLIAQAIAAGSSRNPNAIPNTEAADAAALGMTQENQGFRPPRPEGYYGEEAVRARQALAAAGNGAGVASSSQAGGQEQDDIRGLAAVRNWMRATQGGQGDNGANQDRPPGTEEPGSHGRSTAGIVNGPTGTAPAPDATRQTFTIPTPGGVPIFISFGGTRAGGTGDQPGQPGGFSPLQAAQDLQAILASMRSARAAPDPERAKELLRGLQDPGVEIMMRLDRIVRAENAGGNMAPADSDHDGWKCAICMEGSFMAEGSTEDAPVASGSRSASVDMERRGSDNSSESQDPAWIEDDVEMHDVESMIDAGRKAQPVRDDSRRDARGRVVDPRVQDEKTNVKVFPCNHVFHEDCLEPWFHSKTTCPSCRFDIDPLSTTLRQPQQVRTFRPMPRLRRDRDGQVPYTRPTNNPQPAAGNHTGAQPGSAADGNAAPANTAPGPTQGPPGIRVLTFPLQPGASFSDIMTQVFQTLGMPGNPPGEVVNPDGAQQPSTGQAVNAAGSGSATAPSATASATRTSPAPQESATRQVSLGINLVEYMVPFGPTSRARAAAPSGNLPGNPVTERFADNASPSVTTGGAAAEPNGQPAGAQAYSVNALPSTSSLLAQRGRYFQASRLTPPGPDIVPVANAVASTSSSTESPAAAVAAGPVAGPNESDHRGNQDGSIGLAGNASDRGASPGSARPVHTRRETTNLGFRPTRSANIRVASQPDEDNFSPASPAFDPTEPHFSPASPNYRTASPTFSPASPGFSPASPMFSPPSPVRGIGSQVRLSSTHQLTPPGPPAPRQSWECPRGLQTLEEWIISQEESMHWRCSDQRCLYAPPKPVPANSIINDGVMDAPWAPSGEQVVGVLWNPLTENHNQQGPDTALCCHLFHPSCLKESCQSMGWWKHAPDAEKITVRCPRCRNQGWVKGADMGIRDVEENGMDVS